MIDFYEELTLGIRGVTQNALACTWYNGLDTLRVSQKYRPLLHTLENVHCVAEPKGAASSYMSFVIYYLPLAPEHFDSFLLPQLSLCR